MRTLIIDLESNGLLMQATKIWAVCAADLDTGETFELYDSVALQDLLDRYDQYIAHNGIMFDFPLLNKLWGIKYDYKRIIDTLILSRLLHPDRKGGHSLSAWGNRLGCAKGDFTDFSTFSKEMVAYCHQDIKVTKLLYTHLLNEIKDYKIAEEPCIELEHNFAHVMSKQVLSGFKLDKVGAASFYAQLVEEYTPLKEDIQGLMPKVRDDTAYKKVAREGNLLSETETTFTYAQNKTRKIVTKEFKFKEPNVGSRQQLIKWFKLTGWQPTKFTEKGQPEIDAEVLEEIGSLEALKCAQLFILKKKMSSINDGKESWFKHYNEETKRVHGSVHTNAANTGRCTHSAPNMAQIDKKDKRMRGLWIPPEGRILFGTDAAGLELRLLGHYLYPYDKGTFANEVHDRTEAKKTDPTAVDIHTYNQHLLGLNTRDAAKGCIYALVYGAGVEQLGSLYASDKGHVGVSKAKLKAYGGVIKGIIKDNFTGYKELSSKVQSRYKQIGFLRGIDGRPLHPREDYSALNLLIQSCGAILVKQWTVNIYNMVNEKYKYTVDWELHANVHDEVQLSCRPDMVEELKIISKEAMIKAGEYLNIKSQLDVDVKVGNNWSETH